MSLKEKKLFKKRKHNDIIPNKINNNSSLSLSIQEVRKPVLLFLKITLYSISMEIRCIHCNLLIYLWKFLLTYRFLFPFFLLLYLLKKKKSRPFPAFSPRHTQMFSWSPMIALTGSSVSWNSYKWLVRSRGSIRLKFYF